MCDRGKYNDFCDTKKCSRECKEAHFARPYERYQPRWCDDRKKLRPWKEHANLKSLHENDDNCTPWELEEQSDEELDRIMLKLDEINKLVFPPTETEKIKHKWEDRVRRKNDKLKERPCVPRKKPFSLFNRFVEEETCDESKYKRIRTPKHGTYWAAPVRPLNPCTRVARHLMQPPDCSTTRRCVCGKANARGGCGGHHDNRGCTPKSCCQGKPNQDMCEAAFKQHGFVAMERGPQNYQGMPHSSNYDEENGYAPTIYMEESNFKSETTIQFGDEDTEAEEEHAPSKHEKKGKEGKHGKKDKGGKKDKHGKEGKDGKHGKEKKGGGKSHKEGKSSKGGHDKSEKSHGSGKSEKSHGGKSNKSKGGKSEKSHKKEGKSSHKEGKSSKHAEESENEEMAANDTEGEEVPKKSHEKSEKSHGGKSSKSHDKKSKGGESKKSKKSKKSDKEGKKSKKDKKGKSGSHSNKMESQDIPEIRMTLAPPVASPGSNYSKITRSNHSHVGSSNVGSDFSHSPLSSTYIRPEEKFEFMYL